MGQSRKRERFLFWLYPDTDRGVIDIIDYFKGLKDYSFVQAIRDGLRLIADLREGRVDVLLELFPWIEDRFSRPTGLSDGVEYQISEILKKLDERPVDIGIPSLPDEEDLIFDWDVSDDEDSGATSEIASMLKF